MPAAALRHGDRVRVRPGEVVPADGVIRSGDSAFDESLLTGESNPVARSAGGRVLAGAHVSVAMGRGAAAAASRADAVLIGDDPRELLAGIDIARRARRIVKQNLAWAVGYNLVALPLAAAGAVPPWAAAIGMSLSSLAVAGNALRLGRIPGAAGS